MYQKSTKITTVIHFKKPLQSETKLLRQQSTPVPLPFIQSWRSLLFSTGSSNSGTALHEGVGREKAFISFINLQLAKSQKGRRFKAKCLN